MSAAEANRAWWRLSELKSKLHLLVSQRAELSAVIDRLEDHLHVVLARKEATRGTMAEVAAEVGQGEAARALALARVRSRRQRVRTALRRLALAADATRSELAVHRDNRVELEAEVKDKREGLRRARQAAQPRPAGGGGFGSLLLFQGLDILSSKNKKAADGGDAPVPAPDAARRVQKREQSLKAAKGRLRVTLNQITHLKSTLNRAHESRSALHVHLSALDTVLKDHQPPPPPSKPRPKNSLGVASPSASPQPPPPASAPIDPRSFSAEAAARWAVVVSSRLARLAKIMAFLARRLYSCSRSHAGCKARIEKLRRKRAKLQEALLRLTRRRAAAAAEIQDLTEKLKSLPKPSEFVPSHALHFSPVVPSPTAHESAKQAPAPARAGEAGTGRVAEDSDEELTRSPLSPPLPAKTTQKQPQHLWDYFISGIFRQSQRAAQSPAPATAARARGGSGGGGGARVRRTTSLSSVLANVGGGMKRSPSGLFPQHATVTFYPPMEADAQGGELRVTASLLTFAAKDEDGKSGEMCVDVRSIRTCECRRTPASVMSRLRRSQSTSISEVGLAVEAPLHAFQLPGGKAVESKVSTSKPDIKDSSRVVSENEGATEPNGDLKRRMSVRWLFDPLVNPPPPATPTRDSGLSPGGSPGDSASSCARCRGSLETLHMRAGKAFCSVACRDGTAVAGAGTSPDRDQKLTLTVTMNQSPGDLSESRDSLGAVGTLTFRGGRDLETVCKHIHVAIMLARAADEAPAEKLLDGPAVAVAAEHKQPSPPPSPADDTTPLEIEGESAILPARQFRRIIRRLPLLYQLYSWRKVFSMGSDGASLEPLCTLVGAFRQLVVIIRPSNGEPFGCFLAHMKRGVAGGAPFGTRECFVWRTKREGRGIRVFPWTKGAPDTFVTLRPDLFQIGAGPAILLGKRLRDGQTAASATFRSPPLVDLPDAESAAVGARQDDKMGGTGGGADDNARDSTKAATPDVVPFVCFDMEVWAPF